MMVFRRLGLAVVVLNEASFSTEVFHTYAVGDVGFMLLLFDWVRRIKSASGTFTIVMPVRFTYAPLLVASMVHAAVPMLRATRTLSTLLVVVDCTIIPMEAAPS